MKARYVSVDVETNGPVPGIYSMLSFGCVAYNEEGVEVGSFTRTLLPLEDTIRCGQTMAWWALQSVTARANAFDGGQYAGQAMAEFAAWYPEGAILMVSPAALDGMWVRWYCDKFLGMSPFGHRVLNMRSYMYGIMGIGYLNVCFPETPHIALEDARIQGDAFFATLRAASARFP